MKRTRKTAAVISRNDVVRYVLHEFYNDDLAAMAKATGCTRQQINSWYDGTRTLQKSNVGTIMHYALAPEFKVIAEYEPVDTTETDEKLRAQLARVLKGYERASGLYAFYDSMANLIYIGKSDGNLFSECHNRLRAKVAHRVFPKGAKQPKIRLDMVRYVSAYHVTSSDFADYAKHIESLILRISKPVLNRNLGRLESA